MPKLDESVEAIIDAIVAAVQTAVDDSGEDGLLQDVKAVVRGDRARPMPELPAVWVVPQPAQMLRGTYGNEDWSFPVSIAGLVKADDPASGGRSSQAITALARSAALLCKSDMDSRGAQVTDVVSTSFDPTARSSEQNRTLFWTEATVTVTFVVNE